MGEGAKERCETVVQRSARLSAEATFCVEFGLLHVKYNAQLRTRTFECACKTHIVAAQGCQWCGVCVLCCVVCCWCGMFLSVVVLFCVYAASLLAHRRVDAHTGSQCCMR